MACYAPYNFIPFEEEFKYEFESSDQLPAHNRIDPELHSGVIRYNIVNKTEIAIGNHDSTGFTRDGQGRPVIPGSTMRGFIRSHAEILSFAYPEFVDDTVYLYRSFASSSASRRKAYTDVAFTGSGRDAGLSESVQACIITYDKDAPSDHQYQIHFLKPIVGRKTYLPYLELDLSLSNQNNHLGLPDSYFMYNDYVIETEEDGEKITHRGTPIGNPNSSYRPFNSDVVYAYDLVNKEIRIPKKGDGFPRVTLFNNAQIGQGDGAKKHLYLISAEEDMDKKPIDISQKFINDFKRDLERNNQLGTTDLNKGSSNREDIHSFYNLPDEKTPEKAFFFNYDKGVLRSIGTSPYMRIPYNYSTMYPYQEKKGISWPDAIFGFISDESSYKGRVSFSPAVSENTDIHEKMTKYLAGSPSGTAVQMYLDQTGKNAADLSTYADPGFTLRGNKFYWKRNQTAEYKPEPGQNVNDKILSKLFSIPKNTRFSGTITFENLNDNELGLLLSALQYKKKDSSDKEEFMIGRGKPYGYGRIEIKDVSLDLIDEEKRFTETDPASCMIASDDKVEDFKNKFRKNADSIPYEDHDSIKIYKKYASEGNISSIAGKKVYMSVDEYATNKPLPSADAVFHEIETGESAADYQPAIKESREDKLDKTDPIKNNSLIIPIVWVVKDKFDKKEVKNLQHKMKRNFQETQIKMDKDSINQAAEHFVVIYLPANTPQDLVKLAKEKYLHVYGSVMQGRKSDFKILK